MGRLIRRSLKRENEATDGELAQVKIVIDRGRNVFYGGRNQIEDNSMKQTWQIRFKKKCIDAGMNSGEAADKMGVSRSYLSEVLNEKKLVGPTLALKLESMFGLSAMDILTKQMKDDLKREKLKALKRKKE
jgi:plasmid maintenance system antidote protein VapI